LFDTGLPNGTYKLTVKYGKPAYTIMASYKLPNFKFNMCRSRLLILLFQVINQFYIITISVDVYTAHNSLRLFCIT